MKYSKELKIGVFVVAVLVMSFFVINYLRGEDIFNKVIKSVNHCLTPFRISPDYFQEIFHLCSYIP